MNPRSNITAPVAPRRSISTGSLLSFCAAFTISFIRETYFPATPSFSARAIIRFAIGSFSIRPETPSAGSFSFVLTTASTTSASGLPSFACRARMPSSSFPNAW